MNEFAAVFCGILALWMTYNTAQIGAYEGKSKGTVFSGIGTLVVLGFAMLNAWIAWG